MQRCLNRFNHNQSILWRKRQFISSSNWYYAFALLFSKQFFELSYMYGLFFQITGIVFISVGAVILVMYNCYSNFVDNWLFAVPILMIIVGIIVFLTSFFGCCGAVKENHCMIITVSVEDNKKKTKKDCNRRGPCDYCN